MLAPVPFDRRAHPAGLSAGEWRAGDGWVLRRLDWRATPARGRLLFLSGRADFAEKYLEAMAHWQARGWSVTSFDWRGQGGSRGRERGEAALPALLDDLAAFVRVWDAGGAGPGVVVAHSMGGHLALRLMLERGWRPAAAVLVAPMIGIATGPIPRPAAALIARAMIALGRGDRPIARDPGRMREALLSGSAERIADAAWWRAANPGWALGPPRWSWIADALRSGKALAAAPVPDDLPPLLMLAAGRDHLVSNAAIERMAARTRATLRRFSAARHEILREADPVRLEALAAIDDFFDGVVTA